MQPETLAAADASCAAPALSEVLPAPPPARRILVIRLGALGDVVRTRFAFASLRQLYPAARIDWLVDDRAAAGLEALQGLDETLTISRRELRAARPLALLQGVSTWVRELRARRYDLSLDFHGVLKSALLARAAGIPLRIGYARGISREGSALLLTHRVSFRPQHVSRFARNDALVRYLGGEACVSAPPLDLGRVALGRPVSAPARVVLHPGTSESTRYKRWDPARYGRVAQQLGEHAGAETLVSWGPVPGEREAAMAVVDASGGAARLASETPSISAILALLRSASLFVGGDSGPLHLASLAGLPVVAVFGPTDPVENAPFPGAPWRVVRRDVGCNPCRLGCPERACLAAVTPEAVVEAALELLRQQAAR